MGGNAWTTKLRLHRAGIIISEIRFFFFDLRFLHEYGSFSMVTLQLQNLCESYVLDQAGSNRCTKLQQDPR